MRFFCSTLFLVAATALSAEELSGKWQIHTSAAGRENTQTCTFTQKGGGLSGSCVSERGTVTLTGKVDGKNVTWTYKTESEGGPVTVVFRGAFESAAKIGGSVTAEEFSVTGEFSGTPVK